MPHLLNLIRLALRSLGLQVQDLSHAFAREDMVAAFDSFFKAQLRKQTAGSFERDIAVRSPTQYLIQQFVRASHEAGSLSNISRQRHQKQKGPPTL